MSIKAVIFDLDGLLIDSEPLWRRAMIKCFTAVGCTLTEQECLKTQGRRINEVVEYWNQERGLACDHVQLDKDITSEVKRIILEEGESMPGVDHIFEFLAKKNIKLGLASSSDLDIIDAAIDRLNIRQNLQVIASAQFEKQGKPDPAVYLTACKKLDVDPKFTLAFEDSVNGLKAAKAAGMLCVSIPDPHSDKNFIKENADFVLDSLLEFDEQLWNNLVAKL